WFAVQSSFKRNGHRAERHRDVADGAVCPGRSRSARPSDLRAGLRVPGGFSMSALVRSIWAYRFFILGSVKREVQAKYRTSMLGAAWTVLHPLAMIIVYTVIFSQVMRAKLPGMDGNFAYSIYLCAGLLTWGLCAEIVGRGQIVFIENANLLKKLNFPRICLPV